MFTKEDVLQYVEEEDVRFIRLAYFDAFGVQKNVSIMPGRLGKAFEKGVSIDPGYLTGLQDEKNGELVLRPDPSTMTLLPWRSSQSAVIHMICDLYQTDGQKTQLDSRGFLKAALKQALMAGLDFTMASKFEFYLFRLDDQGQNTRIPFDEGSYMDVAPKDRGENVRRDICLILDEMGLEPHKSFHQDGPGQNEIDFHFTDPLCAADEASIFKWVVRTSAHSNGLFADFSPKPISDQAGNGLHVQIKFPQVERETLEQFMAGILKYLPQASLFLNPIEDSYKRLGKARAPLLVNWSMKNRNVYLRNPLRHPNLIELRQPDCVCNPYLVFSLMILAGLQGVQEQLTLPDPDMVDESDSPYRCPQSLQEAKEWALQSEFVRKHVPDRLLEAYIRRQG